MPHGQRQPWPNEAQRSGGEFLLRGLASSLLRRRGKPVPVALARKGRPIVHVSAAQTVNDPGSPCGDPALEALGGWVVARHARVAEIGPVEIADSAPRG